MSTIREDGTGVVWRKSSRSSTEGNCIEVAVWRKSSRSSTESNCVEVAAWRASTGVVGVRDSKNPHGPRLALTPAAWGSFLAGIKAGPPAH